MYFLLMVFGTFAYLWTCTMRNEKGYVKFWFFGTFFIRINDNFNSISLFYIYLK